LRAGARADGRRLVGAAAIGCALLAAAAARAQTDERFAVHGLQDLELFKTDADSWLLAKNDGQLAGAGRLRLWVAGDFAPGLTGVVIGELEGGKARDPDGTTSEIEQAFLRYVTPGTYGVTIDAGKVVNPFGNFSTRYLSNVNPLIGSPDDYSVAYPEGVVVTGKVSWFDYRFAVVDRPFTNPKYVPESDRALRPGFSVGATPFTGFRLSAFATKGPYLGAEVEPMLPAGQGWRDFDQEVAGLELAFSRGYFELNGEYAYSVYDVPTKTGPSRGRAWFCEPKYTWTPRFFTALRVEHNDYPFILPINSFFWVAQNAAFYDAELGFGWRFTSGLLVKASYRRDLWRDASLDPPNGYAIALQLSYAFDVKSWFEPR
jgi:hypothetical protein